MLLKKEKSTGFNPSVPEDFDFSAAGRLRPLKMFQSKQPFQKSFAVSQKALLIQCKSSRCTLKKINKND